MRTKFPDRWSALVLLAVGFMAFGPTSAWGQGCIAVRGGQCSLGHSMDMMMGTNVFGAEQGATSGYMQKGDWLASVGYRWLFSDRHFKGDVEQKHRKANGTEVINDSHFIDVSLLYSINERFSAGLTIPFVHSIRSAGYEHPGAGRNSSSAGGLGDVRLTGYAWVFDPKKATRGNISLGIGPKFPTGQHAVQDTFQTAAGPVTGTVDQSIQPGDGSFGISTELFGFLLVAPRTSIYGQGAYLINPRNHNGVSTTTGRARSTFESVMSVTDQYLARAGVQYQLVPKWGLAVSLGGRFEGVPVEDFIGRSHGFRRPGYTISIEPGIVVAHKSWTFNVSTPVALYRNRLQSIPDKRRTAATGTYRHGDAAFADYLVTFSASRRF